MHPDFHLSPEESELVENSAWLLTKHRIIGKVYGLFGDLSEHYTGILSEYAEFLPDEINGITPKIYRGEKYRQLPYVMLDHPRLFRQKDVFAIRTFFWWGNSFSIHLVLGGEYRHRFEKSLYAQLKSGALDHWYLAVSDEPWEHHFERDNYLPAAEYKSSLVNWKAGNYIKLGKWHPLNDWKGASTFFIASYRKLLESIL